MKPASSQRTVEGQLCMFCKELWQLGIRGASNGGCHFEWWMSQQLRAHVCSGNPQPEDEDADEDDSMNYTRGRDTVPFCALYGHRCRICTPATFKAAPMALAPVAEQTSSGHSQIRSMWHAPDEGPNLRDD